MSPRVRSPLDPFPSAPVNLRGESSLAMEAFNPGSLWPRIPPGPRGIELIPLRRQSDPAPKHSGMKVLRVRRDQAPETHGRYPRAEEGFRRENNRDRRAEGRVMQNDLRRERGGLPGRAEASSPGDR